MLAKHRDQAAAVHQRFTEQAQRIRNRTELTNDAKVGMLARAHADAKRSLDELQAAAEQETAAERGRLHQAAFGLSNLGGDPNTLIVSARDAADRAEKLTTAKDAAAMLQRAELSSDEPLARAVAAHAFTRYVGQSDPEWFAVVDSYADRRPAQASAIGNLDRIARTSIQQQFSDAGHFYLPTPSELQGIPAGRLATLAAADA